LEQLGYSTALGPLTSEADEALTAGGVDVLELLDPALLAAGGCACW